MAYIKIMGVYEIRNKVNNKVYIGSSVNIKQRWNEHKRTLNKNIHHNRYLQRSWNKYGEENFEFKLIEIVSEENGLLEREQYWMDNFNCYERKFGYNNSKIAENCLGVKHTDETRKKMSESSKGFKHTEESKRKIGDIHRCKKVNPVTDETREKLSRAGKGRRHTDETKKFLSERQIGELNHSSILTDDEVKDIRLLLKFSSLTQKEIADLYNTKFQNISNIKLNKSWKHVVINEIEELPNNLKISSDEIIKNREHKYRLTIDEVVEIKNLLRDKNLMQKEIARIFNVNPVAISDIKRGRTWSYVTI